jgi:hypothetical protein
LVRITSFLQSYTDFCTRTNTYRRKLDWYGGVISLVITFLSIVVRMIGAITGHHPDLAGIAFKVLDLFMISCTNQNIGQYE